MVPPEMVVSLAGGGGRSFGKYDLASVAESVRHPVEDKIVQADLSKNKTFVNL